QIPSHRSARLPPRAARVSPPPRLQRHQTACLHAACRLPGTAQNATACPAWPLLVCYGDLLATRVRREAVLPPVVRPWAPRGPPPPGSGVGETLDQRVPP